MAYAKQQTGHTTRPIEHLQATLNNQALNEKKLLNYALNSIVQQMSILI